MNERARETLGGVILIAVVLAAATGWYFGYAQPREEFLLTVADCTENASQEEWDRCVTVVQEGTQ